MISLSLTSDSLLRCLYFRNTAGIWLEVLVEITRVCNVTGTFSVKLQKLNQANQKRVILLTLLNLLGDLQQCCKLMHLLQQLCCRIN